MTWSHSYDYNLAMKIVSGGQTGVDRGALDAALSEGISCGGWCPEGRQKMALFLKNTLCKSL